MPDGFPDPLNFMKKNPTRSREGHSLTSEWQQNRAADLEGRGYTVTSGTRRGRGQSKHGTGGALDIRTRDLTQEQGDALIAEAKERGDIPLDERVWRSKNWSGPHIHISQGDALTQELARQKARRKPADDGMPNPADFIVKEKPAPQPTAPMTEAQRVQEQNAISAKKPPAPAKTMAFPARTPNAFEQVINEQKAREEQAKNATYTVRDPYAFTASKQAPTNLPIINKPPRLTLTPKGIQEEVAPIEIKPSAPKPVRKPSTVLSRVAVAEAKRRIPGLDLLPDATLENLIGQAAGAATETVTDAPVGLAVQAANATPLANQGLPEDLRQKLRTAPIEGVKRAVQPVRDIVAEQLPIDPNAEGFLNRTLPRAAGSALPYIATGVATRGASPLASAMLGTTQAAAQGYDDAAAHGANPDLAIASGAVNSLTGLLESVGMGRWLHGVGGKQALTNRALQVLEEGGTEGLQDWFSDVNAKIVSGYDPKRNIGQNVPESVLAGLLIGTGAQGAGMVSNRAPVPEAEIPEPAPPTVGTLDSTRQEYNTARQQQLDWQFLSQSAERAQRGEELAPAEQERLIALTGKLARQLGIDPASLVDVAGAAPVALESPPPSPQTAAPNSDFLGGLEADAGRVKGRAKVGQLFDNPKAAKPEQAQSPAPSVSILPPEGTPDIIKGTKVQEVKVDGQTYRVRMPQSMNRGEASIHVKEQLKGQTGSATVPPSSASSSSPSQPSPPTSPTTVSQPAPIAPETEWKGFKGMGAGLSDSLYDALWAKVEKGDIREAGQVSTVLQAAKMVRDAGGLRSRDEFKRFAQEIQTAKNRNAEMGEFREIMTRYLPTSPTTTSQPAPVIESENAREIPKVPIATKVPATVRESAKPGTANVRELPTKPTGAAGSPQGRIQKEAINENTPAQVRPGITQSGSVNEPSTVPADDKGAGRMDVDVATGQSPASVSRESDIYRTKGGRANEAQLDAIDARASKRGESEKGEHGKISAWARKGFPSEQGRTTPLALQPELRRFLGLPAIPQNADNATLNKAAQHTMDALAERMGKNRSSEIDIQAHEDFLTQNRLPDAVVDAYSHTLAAHRAQMAFEDGTADLPEVKQAIKEIEDAQAKGEKRTAKTIREQFSAIAQAYGLPKVAGERFANEYFALKRGVPKNTGELVQGRGEAETAEVSPAPEPSPSDRAGSTERGGKGSDAQEAEQGEGVGVSDLSSAAREMLGVHLAEKEFGEGSGWVYDDRKVESLRARLREGEIDPRRSEVRESLHWLTQHYPASDIAPYEIPGFWFSLEKQPKLSQYRSALVTELKHHYKLSKAETDELLSNYAAERGSRVVPAGEGFTAKDTFRYSAADVARIQQQAWKIAQRAIPESQGGFTTSAFGVGAFSRFNEADIRTIAKHFVAHARDYVSWTKAMVKDFGNSIRPQLRKLWEGLKTFAKDERGMLNERRVVELIQKGLEKSGIAEKKKTRADIENSPEFKRWFGDSKVVDETGKPLIVYHGTNADVEFFSASASGGKTGNVTSGLGFFFTPTRAEANRYATGWQKEGANIVPVYLSLKNPYEMPYRDFDDLAMQVFRGATDKDARTKVARLQKELAAEGYDGVIVNKGKATAEYIAFSPTQIKSAFNRGTFDPTNPNISASVLGGFQSLFEKKSPRLEAVRKLVPIPKEYNFDKLLETLKEVIGERKLSDRKKQRISQQWNAMIDAYNADDGAALIKHQQELKRTLGSHWWVLADMLRPLNATGEISVIGRQGLIGWATHPILSGRALKNAAFKDGSYYDWLAKFSASGGREFAEKAGVDYGLSHELQFGKQDLSAEENAMVSGLRKIPFFKQMERLNKTFIDGQRTLIFDWGVKQIQKSGKEIRDDKGNPSIHVQRWAKEVNRVTGRGSIKRGLTTEVVNAMSLVGYSPRFAISRFQALNPVRLATEIRHSPTTAKIIAKDYAKLAAVSTALALVGIAAGFEVNLSDPDDDDFLVLKRGQWRIPILQGGLHAQAKYAIRALRRFKEMGAGDAFTESKGVPRLAQQTGKFLRYKEAPLTRVVHDQFFDRRDVKDFVTGEKVNMGHDALGRPVSFAQSLGASGLPILYQQLYEAYKDEGLLGMAKISPEFLGLASNLYNSSREPVSDSDKIQSRGDQVKPRFSYAGGQTDKWAKVGLRSGQENEKAFGVRVGTAKQKYAQMEGQLKQGRMYQILPEEDKTYLRELLQRKVAEESNTGEAWKPEGGWQASLYESLKRYKTDKNNDAEKAKKRAIPAWQ